MKPRRRLRHPLLLATLVGCVCACAGAVAPTGDGGADVRVDVVSSDRGDVPVQVCFVDFPCRPGETMRCTGASTFTRLESRPCTAVCPPGPCSGGVCQSTGVAGRCPSGTVCVTNPATRLDECAPLVDAGPPDGSVCPHRPDPAMCCYQDSDCGGDMICFSPSCATMRPGECVARVDRPNCWRDSDCAATDRCVGTSYCPCGALCAIGTGPGRCMPR